MLHDLFGGLPVPAAYVAGPDLVFEFANDAYRHLVGCEDLLGQPLSEALPELAAQSRAELITAVLESGQPFRGYETELSVRRVGASAPEAVFVECLYQPVQSVDGRADGVLLLVSDVTEQVSDRRRQEALTAQLAATQERYQTLFETMPQGVIYYDTNGLILGANPAAAQILGVDEDEMITWPLAGASQSVHEDGSPLAPADFPVTVALRTGEVVTDVVIGVPHGRTGELRWLTITAVPDALDDQGRPQRAYAMFRDLTNERRAAAALREGTELMGRLREANVIGVVVNGEDHVHDANDAFLDIIGYTREDVEAGFITRELITAPEWVDADADAYKQLKRTGAFRPYEKEYVHRDGHRVPVLVGAAVVRYQPLRWVTYIVDLTARQRAEHERALLLARERTARAEADGAQERVAFLLQAGDMVAAAQDRHELLQHAALLVVHSLADFCLVFLPGPDGVLRAISIAHREPGGGVDFTDLRAEPVPALGTAVVRSAYVSGTTGLIRDAAIHMAPDVEDTPPLRDIVARIRPGNVMVTPLMAGSGPLGVLAVGRGADHPSFTDTDVAVVEGLARQTAVGLANAAISARDHTVAETLQRSVLPDTLPDIPGLDLAVRYLPGTAGVDVGGDWYDAFPLDDGRVGLVIGDVVGHNVGSASIMGQVRHLLRAYAVDRMQPADVLRRTARAQAKLLPDALATVVYALLDPATGDLTYANAGHPPPVWATASGQAGYLDDAAGVMLGVPVEPCFTVGHRTLEPGTSLMFYTDGLIEDRGRDITDGLSALADVMGEVMGSPAPLSAEQTCAVVQAALLGDTPRADDVCLLAVRLTGLRRPAAKVIPRLTKRKKEHDTGTRRPYHDKTVTAQRRNVISSQDVSHDFNRIRPSHADAPLRMGRRRGRPRATSATAGRRDQPRVAGPGSDAGGPGCRARGRARDRLGHRTRCRPERLRPAADLDPGHAGRIRSGVVADGSGG
ncbi:MAG TPA: SpoIIE family protein phosphatase [Streptosporangiaceae bacterium]